MRCWLSWRLFGSACPATPSPLRWLESERTGVSLHRGAEEDVGYEGRHAGRRRALGEAAGELEPRKGERGGAQTSLRIPGSYAAARQGASRAAAVPFECWREGKPPAIVEAARGQSGPEGRLERRPVRRGRRGGEEERRVEGRDSGGSCGRRERGIEYRFPKTSFPKLPVLHFSPARLGSHVHVQLDVRRVVLGQCKRLPVPGAREAEPTRATSTSVAHFT